MTDVDESTSATGNEREDDGLREMIRGALGRDPSRPPDVLRGVQRRIRERSGGRFYGDQWSTAKHPPVATYLVTSAVMLAIVLAIYAVLRPLSGEPQPAPEQPAPVRVLPPIPGHAPH
jgi:hypothetical protein